MVCFPARPRDSGFCGGYTASALCNLPVFPMSTTLCTAPLYIPLCPTRGTAEWRGCRSFMTMATLSRLPPLFHPQGWGAKEVKLTRPQDSISSSLPYTTAITSYRVICFGHQPSAFCTEHATQRSIYTIGLGGLGVTCSPRDPRFVGSNPAEVN